VARLGTTGLTASDRRRVGFAARTRKTYATDPRPARYPGMTRINSDLLPPTFDYAVTGGLDASEAGRQGSGRAPMEDPVDIPERASRHGRRPTTVGVPAATAKNANDPTAVPTPLECRPSLVAIAAAGFTDVHLRPVPYFNQGHDPWDKHPYPRYPPVQGEARTIKNAGCAPTALAMIDCGLRNSHVDPTVVADFSVNHRVSGAPGGGGTDTAGLARTWANNGGLGLVAARSSNQSKNVDVLKAGLLADGIALVSVGPGHFAKEGHVLVVNGCAIRNGEEWFAVANPGRENQAHPKSGLPTTDAKVTQITDARNGVGQVWISRTQLEAEMKRCFVFRSGAES